MTVAMMSEMSAYGWAIAAVILTATAVAALVLGDGPAITGRAIGLLSEVLLMAVALLIIWTTFTSMLSRDSIHLLFGLDLG